jgi:hypothetical protein
MKLPVYEFAQHVESKIESLPDDVIRLPALDREAKKYIEEYSPIARLALMLNASGLKTEVETTEEGAEADGVIYISGWLNNELRVQVTHYFNAEMAMRMELLNKCGATPMSGKLCRNKVTGEIKAEFGGIDTHEHYCRLAKELSSRIDAKCNKEYKTKMLLLISFSECKLLGFSSWKILFQLMERQIEAAKSDFFALYFLNQATNEIQRA